MVAAWVDIVKPCTRGWLNWPYNNVLCISQSKHPWCKKCSAQELKEDQDEKDMLRNVSDGYVEAFSYINHAWNVKFRWFMWFINGKITILKENNCHNKFILKMIHLHNVFCCKVWNNWVIIFRNK